MASITVRLEGQDQFAIRVDNHENQMIKSLGEVTNRNTSKVTRIAKKHVRVNTGETKRSIRKKDVSRRIGRPKGLANTVTARAGAGGWRQRFIEGGTGPRKTFRRGIRRRINGRWVTLERDRGRMPTTPFMAPAEAQTSLMHKNQVRAIVLKKAVI